MAQQRGLAVDTNLGWKGAEKYVATAPQIFDLWADPQERYDIFMNNFTESTWIAPVMEGAVHMQITTIGFDLAKNVFQFHGIDAAEKVVVRKPLRRGQVIKFFAGLSPCLVGMEACASAHYWARELRRLGHEVGLMLGKAVM